MSFIFQLAVLDGKPGKREIGAFEKMKPVEALLLDLRGELLISLGLALRFGDRVLFREIGADLRVYLLDILDARFDLCGALVDHIRDGALRLRDCVDDLIPLADLCGEGRRHVGDLRLQEILPAAQGFEAVPVPLILCVFRENGVVAFQQLGDGDLFARRVGVFGKFGGVSGLLIADLSDGRALIIDAGDLVIQSAELRPDADDLQQRVGLFAGRRLHEAGKIERELTDELVEKLLSGLSPGRIRHGERRIFALALHDQTVRERDPDVGRCHGAVALRFGRSVLLSAERPDDSVEDGRFSGAVLPSDDGEPGGGRPK